MNYYNEWDKGAAEWLRFLIATGEIANGVVDERSIVDIHPSDLTGFTQCHFFAGVGGWPLALQLAGVPSTTPLWTGSPPCQPFSVAGKGLAQDDERHLAPKFLSLVRECRPAILFGEQVAAAIKKHWLDDLFTELEREDYTCGATVLPAAGVGAPHQRYRIFFGAANILDYTEPFGWHTGRNRNNGEHVRQQPGAAGEDVNLANADGKRLEGKRPHGYTLGRKGSDVRPAGLRNGAGSGSVANTLNGAQQREEQGAALWQLSQGAGAMQAVAGSAATHHSFWSGADWISCRDGRLRPVESGTFPLANGVPARVGRLRGYGNAIVPEVAAQFIRAFIGAEDDRRNL